MSKLDNHFSKKRNTKEDVNNAIVSFSLSVPTNYYLELEKIKFDIKQKKLINISTNNLIEHSIFNTYENKFSYSDQHIFRDVHSFIVEFDNKILNEPSKVIYMRLPAHKYTLLEQCKSLSRFNHETKVTIHDIIAYALYNTYINPKTKLKLDQILNYVLKK